jgi:hypothetical protein
MPGLSVFNSISLDALGSALNLGTSDDFTEALAHTVSAPIPRVGLLVVGPRPA